MQPRSASMRAENSARLMSEADTARHLNMSPSEFSRRCGEFEKKLGMPVRHPVLCKRDRVAIDQWLNRIFGVEQKPATVAALVRSRMGVLSNGEHSHQALPRS